MTLALASKPGISGATVLHIPKDWDATWFRNFINNLLKGADVRNAVGANGIKVSGNISSPYATIGFSGITSVAGTANQIAVSTTGGVSTLSFPTDVILLGQGNGGSPSAIGFHFTGTIPGSDQFFKIASLPASTAGTLDALSIRGTFNDGWAATGSVVYDLMLGNRNGFVSRWRSQLGQVVAGSGIACYIEAGGDVSVYVRLVAGHFSHVELAVLANNQETIFPDALAITSPTGTLAFDTTSATFPPLSQDDGMSETFNVNSAAFSTGYSGSAGLRINNLSSSMQTAIDFGKAGVLSGRIRNDFVGNMNYVATGSGSHNFLVGGDTGVGATALQIHNGGAISFPGLSTTASAANAFLDSAASNNLLRSTSSIRYKTNVNSLQEADINAVLQMRPVTYTSLCSGDDPTKIHLGFIAEEIAAIDPRLVFYTWNQYQAQDDGLPQPSATAQLVPDGVQYDRIVPLLVGSIQTLTQRVAALEQKTAAITAPSLPSSPSLPSQLSVSGAYGLTGTGVYAGPVIPITTLPSTLGEP
jgi:hypothetical protein